MKNKYTYKRHLITAIFLLMTTFSALGMPIIQAGVETTEELKTADELDLWEAAGFSEDETPADGVFPHEQEASVEPVGNVNSKNIIISVMLDDEIINHEDNYAYAVHVDFDKIDEDEACEDSESFLEGDYGLDIGRLTVLQTEDYITSGFVLPGERIVSVVIPGDYKSMYTYTVSGTDIKEVEFAGEIISYPVIDTQNKNYDIVIEIHKKENYIDYLDSDEILIENFNLNKVLSGEYGESKSLEYEESSRAQTGSSQIIEQEENLILSIVVIIILILLLMIIVCVLYIRYQVNKDD